MNTKPITRGLLAVRAEGDGAPNIKALVAEMNDAFAQFKGRHTSELRAARAEISRLQVAVDETAIALAAGGRRGSGMAHGGLNLRAVLNDNESLRAMKDGNARAAIIPIIGGVQAAVTSDGTGGYTTRPDYDSRIAGVPQRPLALLDVLPTLPVSGGSFQFNQVTSAYANASAYQVKQADSKAAQAVPFAIQTANIATIAAITAASEQVLADEPSLQGRIADLMRYNLRAKLEAELIGGAGGAGKIKGLAPSGTTFTPTATGAIDRVSESIANLAATGWVPSVVVLNPADWHAIRTSKASTSGVYMSGTYDTPASPSLWGVPVVQSASQVAGTALVVDAAQVALLDRMQTTVDLGRMGDDFGQNVVRLRAECRVGLAVFAPGAILNVALSA